MRFSRFSGVGSKCSPAARVGSPAVLFDDVPSYPSGHRVLVNANGTPRRQAVTLGLPEPERAGHEELLAYWRRVVSGLLPLDPAVVDDAPFLQNRATSLEDFPAPVWHPKDGGRFLGTACVVAGVPPCRPRVEVPGEAHLGSRTNHKGLYESFDPLWTEVAQLA